MYCVIYAKAKGGSRYAPVDFDSGKLKVPLKKSKIYPDKASALRDYRFLYEDCLRFDFQIRELGSQRIIPVEPDDLYGLDELYALEHKVYFEKLYGRI